MKETQLKSILNAKFNEIVVDKFDIKEIRAEVRQCRLNITKHFRNGQDKLAMLVTVAMYDLILEVQAHSDELFTYKEVIGA